MTSRLVAVCLTVGVASVGLVGQQSTPSFRTGVTLVPVDVRVTAMDGTAVTNLKASDFLLFEDGVRQEIRQFSTRTLTPDPAAIDLPLAPSRPASADVTPQNRRVLLILVGRGQFHGAIAGLSELVRSALPQDQIAVVAWNRATPFTTNHEPLAQLLDRLAGDHDRIDAEIAELFARQQRGVYDEAPSVSDAIQRDIDRVLGEAVAGAGGMRNDFESAIAALGGLSLAEYASAVPVNVDLLKVQAAISYLRGIDGEKHIVFAALPTNEIAVIDPYRIVEEANGARVAVHFVEIGGLKSATRTATTGGLALVFGRADLGTLSSGTAGSTSRDGVPQAVTMIDNATRFEYVLGYVSSNPTANPNYRKVAVSLNIRGKSPEMLQLFADGPHRERDMRWRAGYYSGALPEPPDAGHVRSQMRIAAAVVAARRVDDIKLTVRATSTQQGATVALQIDPARLTSRIGAGGQREAVLNVFAFCADSRGQFLPNALTQMLQLSVAPGSDGTMGARPTVLRIPLRRGFGDIKYAKVVVYDATADLLGSQIVAVGRSK